MAESSPDSTLFRSPAENAKQAESPERPQEKTPQYATTEDTTNPSELTKLGRPPYIIDLMEGQEAYTTFRVEPLSKEVDDFINAEVERRGLKDTKENYKEVLDEIYKNITPSDNIYTNLENLADWVRIQQKLIEALKEKEAFEAKDPLKMTAKELRRYLYGK